MLCKPFLAYMQLPLPALLGKRCVHEPFVNSQAAWQTVFATCACVLLKLDQRDPAATLCLAGSMLF
jgi:hypothetical protein